MEMSTAATTNSPVPAVLVVDDEALIRWSLAESLTDAGYSVAEAANAKSALELASGASFDAIVLDFRLPDSNDLQLLETIRRLQPRAAVVMMTAFGTPEMTSNALRLGAHSVVAKPFDMLAMVDVVRHAPRP
jgi:DNA-binding NtrC family response regulator